MERLIWSTQMENFQKKWELFEGSPKFPNGISLQKVFVPFALVYQFQAFWLERLATQLVISCVFMMAANPAMFQCASCGFASRNGSFVITRLSIVAIGATSRQSTSNVFFVIQKWDLN